jgi:hypothetical protein
MRSFLRVCRVAGFSKETGWHYWKMFFTVLFRNPAGIEAAVNLAAMFIHFTKQKTYILESTQKTLQNLAIIGEQSFNEKMTRVSGAENTESVQSHC